MLQLRRSALKREILNLMGSAGMEPNRTHWKTKTPIILAVAFLTGCYADTPDPIMGVVVSVYDGDTITLQTRTRTNQKIRLQGVDAPEIKQPYGIESRDTLRKLLLNTVAHVICNKTDKYGRDVCVVYRKNTDINLLMIQAGAAHWYEAFASEQSSHDRKLYEEAQEIARGQRQGLWADKAVPPWEWRKTL